MTYASYGNSLHYKVTEEGLTLLELLAIHTPFSKKEIKRQIEHHHCKLNGQVEIVASTKVARGDIIFWQPIKIEKISFDSKRILFESDEILAYNKPSGVTSDADGLLALLKPYGHFTLVHRLDKETSGVILLAKNKTSEKELLNAFKNREIEKIYVALVHGIPKKRGTIENYLGKVGGYFGQTIYGKVSKEKGKFAKTHWNLQKIKNKNALVTCCPETGRTHQIRVHMSEIGHPILGDYQYGKYDALRLMLHAYKVKWKDLIIVAPIPKEFL